MSTDKVLDLDPRYRNRWTSIQLEQLTNFGVSIKGFLRGAFRCLDGGAGSKATQYATWALANMLVDNPTAQVYSPAFAGRH